MSTDLLSLRARIGLDDSEYNKGIKGAESKAKKLGSGMKAAFKVGAAAVGVTAAAVGAFSKTVYSAAKKTADYGDTIDKQSQRVGLSAEAYQKWDYVLKIAGTEMSNMRIGLKTMTNQLDAAKDGGKEAQENFEKLGISMDEVNTMSREEAFGKVIKGFQSMEDSTERAALANKIFGRSGQELTPLFNQSAESTDELIKKAEDYGMVMSDDAVKASANFKDSLTTLSQTATGLKNRLTGELLPGLTEITDGLALLFTSDGQDEGLEKFTKGLSNTIDNIVNLIPKIVDVGVPIIESVATGIIDNLPKLVDAAFNIISSFGIYILNEAPTVLKIGLDILLSLIQGITENLPVLIPTIVQVITDIVTILTSPEMLTQLIMAALELVIALADGLIQALPQLISQVPVIVENIVNTLIKLAPKLVPVALRLIKMLISGLLKGVGALGSAVGRILGIIPKKIGELITKAKNWGRDMLQGFIDGITEKIQALREKISSVAKTISDKLHFSVPEDGPLADADTWMPDFMDLLASGIDDNKFKVSNAIDGLAGDMVVDGGYYGDGYETINDTQKFEFVFPEGNAPMLQIARMIFPFMQIVAKEKGVA